MLAVKYLMKNIFSQVDEIVVVVKSANNDPRYLQFSYLSPITFVQFQIGTKILTQIYNSILSHTS